MRLPDFVIIGAMKCATTTLHDQLARQDGVFMSDPKEPNFFSDDPVFARGVTWYESLFAGAGEDDLCGESSTHYTKRPAYPHTVERMQSVLSEHVRFVYILRHPIDRLISQYIHEWTERRVGNDINRAIDDLPELIDYSRYAMQIQPYVDAFGRNRLCPAFSERFKDNPASEFARVCAFVGGPGDPVWRADVARNISNQRMRRSAIRQALFHAPGLKQARRRFIPQAWRDRVRRFWTMNDRPELSRTSIARLTSIFDEDLAHLEPWLGIRLTCDTFAEQVLAWSPEQPRRNAQERAA